MWVCACTHTRHQGELCPCPREFSERPVPPAVAGLKIQDKAGMLTFYLLLLLSPGKILWVLAGSVAVTQLKPSSDIPILLLPSKPNMTPNMTSKPIVSHAVCFQTAAEFHPSHDCNFGTQRSQPKLHTHSSPACKGSDLSYTEHRKYSGVCDHSEPDPGTGPASWYSEGFLSNRLPLHPTSLSCRISQPAGKNKGRLPVSSAYAEKTQRYKDGAVALKIELAEKPDFSFHV